MNDQVALAGFEPPHEKELSAYHDILPELQAAAAEIGADATAIRINHGKTYSSVWYESVLAFRLKLRKDSRYVEVPMESKDTVQELDSLSGQKEVSGGFWRVKLGTEPAREHADILARVLQNAVDRMPKDWDCCSRYIECSNAKRCIHPDPSFTLACGYRKILASGKIYYGENRNI